LDVNFLVKESTWRRNSIPLHAAKMRGFIVTPMKFTLLLLVFLLLAACTPTSAIQPEPEVDTNAAAALPDLGVAPELTNDVWLNTTKPLRLADLRGYVVLIEMWTFG
jgi:hypothetical protein